MARKLGIVLNEIIEKLKHTREMVKPVSLEGDEAFLSDRQEGYIQGLDTALCLVRQEIIRG